MKRVAVVAVLLLVLAGCSGVWCNAEYTELLDQTAVLSNETATRAEAGVLTPAEMALALRGQSNVWQRFSDARRGVK